MGSICRYLDSLSTRMCGDHLTLSRQPQKSIKSLGFLLKNPLRSFDIVMKCSWYRYIGVLKIHLAAGMVSVMTTINSTLYK